MQESQTKLSLLDLESMTAVDLKTLLEELTILNNSQGWAHYHNLLLNQIELRKNNVCFTACKSIDAAMAQEFDKGEISGIYQNANLLEVLIEAVENAIENKSKEVLDNV